MIPGNSMMRFRPYDYKVDRIPHVRPDKQKNMATSGVQAPLETGEFAEYPNKAVTEATTKHEILPYKDIFAQTLGGSQADIFYEQPEDDEGYDDYADLRTHSGSL